MGSRTTAATLALCVLAGALSSCTAPGQGEKADAGYSKAKPVIAALQAYHDKRNAYPETLRDLVADALPEPAGEFFEYEKLGASYRLQFSYTGPGMNRCVYTPEAAKWECAGYH